MRKKLGRIQSPRKPTPAASFSTDLAAQSEPLRLSKLMAHLGLCSRREADEYIRQGQVLVDGKVIQELGTKVSPKARVELRDRAQKEQEKKVTIILNKPIGYVSNLPEKGYSPAIELIRPENQESSSQQNPMPLERRNLRGLAVAGRLDIDSQGLLVFTQDGRLARQLIGRDSEIEKEYLVRFMGEFTPEKLRKLCYGLVLDGQPLKPAKVKRINPDQLQFILREGKKRQIRRMCELVGITVTGLKRVRIGNVRLGALSEGQWRFLRADEAF